MRDRRLGAAVTLALLAALVALVAWVSHGGSPPDAGPGGDGAGAAPRAPTPWQGLASRARPPTAAAPSGPTNPASGDESPREESWSVRVETVDATTGAPVPARWNWGTGLIIAAPPPPGVVVDDAWVNASREGVRASRARWEEGFRPTQEAVDYPWSGRDVEGQPLTVRAPEGYVPLELHPRLRADLAAGVREAVVVVPVAREAVLDVRVLDPAGRPAVAATVTGLEVAGSPWEVAAESVGAGVVRLRGIPWLPGARVRAVVEWNPDDGDTGDPGDGEALPTVPELDTTMPADRASPWTAVVRLDGPTGSVTKLYGEDDPRPEPVGRPDRPQPSSETAVGAARVRVLACDGRPIAGADVDGETADARGEVLFEDLAAGEQAFSMRADGHFPARARAVVREGAEVEVVLREPVGAALEVFVVDGEGRPVPSALLDVGPGRVLDVRDGVQRLDLFTDALGRRSLARVEPGRTTVRAHWGGRHAAETVALADGDRAAVRLVLR